MPLIKPRPLWQTTYALKNDRGVRLVKGLACPNYQRELNASEDVDFDLLGDTVLACSGCDLVLLVVG